MSDQTPDTLNSGVKAAMLFEKAFKAKEFGYGDTVPREWLEEAMGWSVDGITTPSEQLALKGRWMSHVTSFKEHLLNRCKICLISIEHPPGYYILPPSKQTAWALSQYIKELGRASRRASEIADNTNIDALTAEEKRQAADDKALLRRLQTATRSAVAAQPEGMKALVSFQE
jgi:hypothetical protein